ncbi:hypothetical protein LINPERHAP1_LOCUS9485 [Linum perenne]
MNIRVRFTKNPSNESSYRIFYFLFSLSPLLKNKTYNER